MGPNPWTPTSLFPASTGRLRLACGLASRAATSCRPLHTQNPHLSAAPWASWTTHDTPGGFIAGSTYSQAGETAPARSRQHGAHASATSRTAMFCRVGLSASVSSASASGSVLAPRAAASALNCSSRRAISWSTAATVSLARPTSCVSLSTRPAPRAAVVARPMVPTLIDLRPRKAPRIVAPTEIAVWMPCCVACSLSRATACSARRRRSCSAACLGAYFWRSSSLALSRSCRVDS